MIRNFVISFRRCQIPRVGRVCLVTPLVKHKGEIPHPAARRRAHSRSTSLSTRVMTALSNPRRLSSPASRRCCTSRASALIAARFRSTSSRALASSASRSTFSSALSISPRSTPFDFQFSLERTTGEVASLLPGGDPVNCEGCVVNQTDLLHPVENRLLYALGHVLGLKGLVKLVSGVCPRCQSA